MKYAYGFESGQVANRAYTCTVACHYINSSHHITQATGILSDTRYIPHRLQTFVAGFRGHQVKSTSHTPEIKTTPIIMHLDYVEFTQTLINTGRRPRVCTTIQ